MNNIEIIESEVTVFGDKKNNHTKNYSIIQHSQYSSSFIRFNTIEEMKKFIDFISDYIKKNE